MFINVFYFSLDENLHLFFSEHVNNITLTTVINETILELTFVVASEMIYH